jgi:hypothetical protein
VKSPRLDPGKVPLGLRHLIPFAERYGITDDLDREHVILASSPEEIAELKAVVAQHDDLMDEWLAGPETAEPQPSVEYLAFSAMRMAADFG